MMNMCLHHLEKMCFFTVVDNLGSVSVGLGPVQTEVVHTCSIDSESEVEQPRRLLV